MSAVEMLSRRVDAPARGSTRMLTTPPLAQLWIGYWRVLMPPHRLSGITMGRSSCMLITMPTSVTVCRPLACLTEFVETHLDDVVDIVHILPFFPSTGDDGFSVMDYRAVDHVSSGVIGKHVSLAENHGRCHLEPWVQIQRVVRRFVDGETPGGSCSVGR